jgi:starvation-inducible outer membrane lipoprotein
MKHLGIATLLLLAGCSHTAAPPPAVEIRTIEILKPVAVACIDKSAMPTEPAKIGGKLTGDARRDLDLVAAHALRLRSWGRAMAAMLSGCAKP